MDDALSSMRANQYPASSFVIHGGGSVCCAVDWLKDRKELGPCLERPYLVIDTWQPARTEGHRQMGPYWILNWAFWLFDLHPFYFLI